MRIKPEEFQETITKELSVIKNRVRNLIGDKNWGDEGRYKEAALKSIIKRFLPKNISLGSGFIIKEIAGEIKISGQIDILLYENTRPLLFKEGDFVITTPDNVKGIIEVKTNMSSGNVRKFMRQCAEKRDFIEDDVFHGFFAYDREHIKIDKNNVNTALIESLEGSKGFLNHMCIGENIFIKFWKRGEPHDECVQDHYTIYKLVNLSFSYFISNLIESVCKLKLDNRWWFMYPIEKGKEGYKIYDLPV